jgi:hypothetical protein
VTTARTVCLLARRRLEKKARASCRSGGETDRRSTTATVQGISPFCDDGRILDIFGTESQLDSLSRAKLIKNHGQDGLLCFIPLSTDSQRKVRARTEHRVLQASKYVETTQRADITFSHLRALKIDAFFTCGRVEVAHTIRPSHQKGVPCGCMFE